LTGCQWQKEERDEVNIRSFLGKMIWRRSFKNFKLSVVRRRKLYAFRMMMERANVMIDEPTNHLT
jgi:ATPase subunit of ABC transporter with duplicated ATPase domains